ncbi:polyprenyl synthetase family protein [Aestuariimicrobium ganziense]|uniref:polyprenyl synthetase family protein n=1 Tax=Aestuariimicrobium ganziense TaxID=2773677 RepID=UPI0019429EE4|nr:polyprenyl synthetase family protein [Aestuariimicrobium ganziense]
MDTFDPRDPVGPAFRDAVGEVLDSFLAERAAALLEISPALEDLTRRALEFSAGGKRLRPAFAWWGHVAAAGEPDDPTALLRACASLDLLHVSALMHDDVMDGSDTRRGVPSAHRQYEALHRDLPGGRGQAEAFGRAGAILLGDLLLVWSTELYDSSGLAPEVLRRAQPLVHAVRSEVTAGQFLDVLAQATGGHPGDPDALRRDLAVAELVLEFKSARYSVRRPVQIGAALGGGDEALVDALGRFGSPLGRAFQLRDDLLGVFGDSQVTGKPAGDDLREGKRTTLIAHALAEAEPADARHLDSLLGSSDLDEEQVDQGRRVIESSGARAQVEADIQTGWQQALDALAGADLTESGRTALVALAEATVQRQH